MNDLIQERRPAVASPGNWLLSKESILKGLHWSIERMMGSKTITSHESNKLYDMNAKRRKWIILALLTLIPTIGYIWYGHSKRNPFDEVTWLKEHPGANDRYVQYTPVLTSDKTIELGPTVGADFASLRFKDLDKDGIKEAIIETELFFDFGEYRSPERHVLKHEIDINGIPKFTLTQSESTGQSGFGE